MADTLKYNEPGAGPAVATDDVGGIHYQRMKLDVGGNGLSSPVEAVDGKIPVSISGLVTTALPTAALLADNQALPTAPQVGAVLKAYDGATTDLVRDIAAAHALLSGVGVLAAGQVVYDPFDAQYRRMEVNGGITVFNAAGFTATQTGATIENRYYRGFSMLWNISAVSGTPTHTLQLRIEERDIIAGAFFKTVWTDGTHVASAGTAQHAYKVYPGSSGVTGGISGLRAIVPMVPGRQYRIVIVPSGGTWSHTLAVHPVI